MEQDDPADTLQGSKTGRSRLRRWGKRLGMVIVCTLTAIGAVSVYRFLNSAPGVGYFRSAEGRAEYVGYYEQAIKQLPEPTKVHDVSTSYGVVRVYEWSTPETENQPPVVLLPGRASGVPMWSTNLPGFAESRRVLAFDALGDAGLSVQSVPLASFEDQAVWIDEVVVQLAPGGVHLVGHSFGGIQSMPGSVIGGSSSGWTLVWRRDGHGLCPVAP